jgi:hypothetical protein
MVTPSAVELAPAVPPSDDLFVPVAVLIQSDKLWLRATEFSPETGALLREESGNHHVVDRN